MVRLTYLLALITPNCIQVKPEKLLTILHDNLHGWVVFGATPRKHVRVSRVFNLNVPTPIEMIDFWITEPMGVAAKPCECEAGKLRPVERSEMKVIEDSCRMIRNQWLIPYPWKRESKELPNNVYKLGRNRKQLMVA